METRKIHLNEAPKVPFKFDGKIMFTSDQIEVIHLTLKPGEQIGEHTQPFDVIFYVLAGQGNLTAGEENLQGIENTLIFVPAGTPRGWKNPGTVYFKELVIKELARV
jgi:quercetin dioxygenase-like cupin family protein